MLDQFESPQIAWTNVSTRDQDWGKLIETILYCCDVSVVNAPLFYREATYLQILLYLSTVASRFPSALLTYKTLTSKDQHMCYTWRVSENRRTAFSASSLIMTNNHVGSTASY